MTDIQVWSRSPFSDAGQLAAQINPDDPASEAQGQSPQEWYQQLTAGGAYHDAAFLLAHALPRYECVVWGAQVLMEMEAVNRLDPIMVGVLRWIDQPSDSSRRQAGDLAEESRKDSPARKLGMAVMMSGGSISGPDFQPVLPPPTACALYVAGAVLSGAGATPDYPAAITKALERGAAIAAGN